MLRSTWWLAVAILAGVSGAASAKAQVCESDDTCPTGQHCSFGDGDGAVTDAPCREGEECVPPPPPMGECAPLPKGYCESQSDCATGLTCIKNTWTSGCAGTDDGAPPPVGEEPADQVPPDCEAEEVTSRYGLCVLPETPCQTDDQCLEGLSCVVRDDKPDEGGGTDPAPAPEPTPDPTTTKDGPTGGVCTYQPATCGNGETCAAGYECVEMVTGEWCSGSGGAPCDPADGDCVPVEPTEPECGETRESFCLPAKDPCSTDADCAADWKCVEFTNTDGGLETPESWNETGAVKSCLPEGLALLAESGGFAGRDSDGPNVGGGGIDEDGASGGEGTGAPSDDASKDADGDASASLCAVKTGTAQPGAAFFALAALAGALVRRRRAR